ncbi:calcium-binding protein [Szabonella alba]|uniref:Calcium-binding protein n=1 Tax=Szabonella alba TaxID=2804194 RepID=A0A8K0XZB5_9RHOB|nr:calcium-binding protein [Szabonella alba]MBL4916950.1 calcium-binding protein [Szabonella alba]
MLAILGLFGAVCAGLLADSVLSARTESKAGDEDAGSASDPAGAAETTETPQDAPPGDMLDWMDDPALDTVIGAALDASDGLADFAPPGPPLDPTNSRDEGPESSDLPLPADPPLTLQTGAGDTILTGSGGADTVLGGPGDDLLGGRAGDDRIDGGAGRDVIDGGTGADRLSGGAGSDTIHAGDGADRIAGGAGADLLTGQEGDDRVRGGAGDDTLLGGAGGDVLAGGTGDDWLAGGGGNDLLHAGPGMDTLDGNDGDDTLFGFDPADEGAARAGGGSAPGVNFLNGGAGNDRLWLAANDHGHGGDGADHFHIGDWIGEGGFARIADFDPAEDEIVVIYDAEAHPDPQVTLIPGEGEQDVVVMLDGFPLAQIAGGAGLDVAQLRIMPMTDLPGPPVA